MEKLEDVSFFGPAENYHGVGELRSTVHRLPSPSFTPYRCMKLESGAVVNYISCTDQELKEELRRCGIESNTIHRRKDCVEALASGDAIDFKVYRKWRDQVSFSTEFEYARQWN